MIGAKLATMKVGNPTGNNQHEKRNRINCSYSTNSDAAEMMNVSTMSIKRAKKVQSQGIPELVGKVESGSNQHEKRNRANLRSCSNGGSWDNQHTQGRTNCSTLSNGDAAEKMNGTVNPANLPDTKCQLSNRQKATSGKFARG